MLTPEQYDQIGDSLTGLFQDLEAFIIQDFVRRVTTAGTITETARYQLIKAEQMGLSTQAIKEALQQALNISNEEINRLFKDWGLEAIRVENGIASQAGINPMTLESHPELGQIIDSAIDQTKGELVNMTGTLGFAQKINGKIVFTELSQYFQKEMDFVQMQVQSGALDYNSAIRQSVKRMADSGLRTVDYASGWSNHLDVAVRRATLTGANQMSGKLTDALGAEMACNFVEVTAHAGARNTGSGPANHASWQGKVYARKGSTKEYPNLAKVTGYGTGAGLKGWNCRHDYNNFWPGYSERTWTDEELANIDPPPFSYKGKEYDYYAANQRQRAIERAIRKTKRELIGYDAAGDKEAFTAASIKLQRQRQEYQSFSKAADLRQKPERQQVYHFDRKISQKAAQARKKQEEKLRQEARERAIIEEIKGAGVKGEVHLKPKKIILDNVSFDEKHINAERAHEVTLEEAKQFIENARISVTVWKGQYERFYSDHGVVYFDLDNNLIRTAFKPEEFKGDVLKLLEVLNKYGL